jgi:hypothetical protein
MSDDIDPTDTFDDEAIEARHLMETRGVTQAEAYRILDEREALRIADLMARYELGVAEIVDVDGGDAL